MSKFFKYVRRVRNLLIGVLPQTDKSTLIPGHLPTLNDVKESLAATQFLPWTRTFAQNFLSPQLCRSCIELHRVSSQSEMAHDFFVVVQSWHTYGLLSIPLCCVSCSQGRTASSCVFKGVRVEPLRFSDLILSVAPECLSKWLKITWLDYGLFATICSQPVLKRRPVYRKVLCSGLFIILMMMLKPSLEHL